MSMLPSHPLPPGGHDPQLNLAGEGINPHLPAGDAVVQPMPDSMPPRPVAPQLSGSPVMGGIDPTRPFIDLNLAGSQGFPAPNEIEYAASVPVPVIGPTFTAPGVTAPSLQPGDAQSGTGMSFAPGGGWEADPALPDLEQYVRPLGLDIHNPRGDLAGLVAPDPVLGELLDYEVPTGLAVYHHVLAGDPAQPALPTPVVEPAVQMAERPGDLAQHALATMHDDATYQQLAGNSYPQVFMDASGMNSHRRRDFTLLMQGLEAEEQGRTL